MVIDRNLELKICIICGSDKKEGIIIHNGFICEVCEKEIVHTEVESVKYPLFIKRMKKLWTSTQNIN